MSTGAALAAVLTVGLLTFGARSVLVLALADRPLRPGLARALRHVAPAVLSALVVTLMAGGEGVGGIEAPEAAAVAAAALVAAWRRDLVVSLVAGMGTLWLVLTLF